MTLLEIFLVAIGLSMDAFAVAICKGLAMPQINKKQTLLIGAYFGVFQALMPLAGWLLGSQFAGYVTKLAPWIAFVLLAWIGGSMIRESLSQGEEDGKPEPAELRHRELLMLAVATSIDALSVGFTISEYGWMMALTAAIIIAVVTFFLCMAGLCIGKKFGTQLSGKANILGGVILIGIGLEIFITGVF